VAKITEKKNETTTEQQACSDAQSMWNKKVEKDGYRPDKSNLINAKVLMPMCAQYFDDRSEYIIFESAYIQPKLDGVRCVSHQNKLLSKNGLKFHNLIHIKKLIKDLALGDGICLDGELYTTQFPFNKISGYVRRKKDDIDEQILKIEFHIFDCFDLNRTDWPFIERHQYLQSIIPSGDILKLVRTEPIGSKDDVGKWHSLFVEQGYEGIMVRNSMGQYNNSKTRSNDLQKYKLTKDNEFTIVNYEEGSGKDKGTVIWTCLANEHTFNVRPKGTYEDRADMFKNAKSYIGKLLKVQYQELSPDGIPRFPVGLYVREID